jgi:hypothetical protein
MKYCASVFLLAVLLFLPEVTAQEPPSVAILDFDSSGADDKELGRKLAEALPGAIEDNDKAYRFVERATFNKILEEQQLSVTGLVDPERGAKMCALISARVLISGRAYKVGDQLWISARIFSVETGRSETVLTKEQQGVELSAILKSLGAKLETQLKAAAGKHAAVAGPDVATQIRETLKRRRLPDIYVLVTSPDVSPGSASAGQIEVLRLLTKAGVHVKASLPETHIKWVADYLKDKKCPPLAGASASISLIGRTRAELAGAVGTMTTASGTADLVALDPRNGRELKRISASATGRGLFESDALHDSLTRASAEALATLIKAIAETIQE